MEFPEKFAEKERVQFGMQVPFGPMLAGAGLIYFLGFNVYVDAYFAEYVSYFFGSEWNFGRDKSLVFWAREISKNTWHRVIESYSPPFTSIRWDMQVAKARRL